MEGRPIPFTPERAQQDSQRSDAWGYLLHLVFRWTDVEVIKTVQTRCFVHDIALCNAEKSLNFYDPSMASWDKFS